MRSTRKDQEGGQPTPTARFATTGRRSRHHQPVGDLFKFQQRHASGGRERYTRYGDLKKDLAALIIESLEPIHKRYDELLADTVELRAVVARGAVKASAGRR